MVGSGTVGTSTVQDIGTYELLANATNKWQTCSEKSEEI